MAQTEKTRPRAGSGTGRKAPTAKAVNSKPRRAAAPLTDRKNALVEAAVAAQKQVLLDALAANNWSLTATAEALRLHGPSAVIRYIRTLDLSDEYERARTRGDLKPGPRSDS